MPHIVAQIRQQQTGTLSSFSREMSSECPAKCSEELSTSKSPFNFNFNSVQLKANSPANCGSAAVASVATRTIGQPLFCVCVCHLCNACVCERHRQLPESPRPPLATVNTAGFRALDTSSHLHATRPIASSSTEPPGTTARLSAPACPLCPPHPSRSGPSGQRPAPVPVTDTYSHVHSNVPTCGDGRQRERLPSQSRSRSPAARTVHQAARPCVAARRHTIRLVDVDADVSDPATHEVLAFLDRHSRHASALLLR